MTSMVARADSSDAARTSAWGLDGLDRTAWPAPQPNYAVAGGAGYGFTESVPGAGDGAHHRLTGTLAAGATLPGKVRWLSLALRFDGRLDFHPPDEDGAGHASGVGDPRLVLRGGYALNDEWQLGGDAILWVPGESAPSIDFSATTTDLRVLAAYDPEALPLSLLMTAGFRIDYSGRAAPQLDRLRSGDRLGLGLSDSHAVLVAVGVNYRVTEDLQLYAEVSGDILVGSGEPGAQAPSVGESPWRVALGSRYPLGRFLVGELQVTTSLSQRPGIAPSDPLVPIEPRVAMSFGLRFGKSLLPPSEPVEPPTEPEPAPAAAPTPTESSVAGQVLDDAGRPLPDSMVVLHLPDGTTRETITDAEGRYVFEDVPLGEAEVQITATGFDEQRFSVVVGAEPYVDPPRALAPHEPMGTLRGLARSFESDPVRARIRVIDARGRKVRDERTGEEGLFELQLPPGQYTVLINARDYHSQRRTIRINDLGVTVLNVDLRERK